MKAISPSLAIALCLSFFSSVSAQNLPNSGRWQQILMQDQPVNVWLDIPSGTEAWPPVIMLHDSAGLTGSTTQLVAELVAARHAVIMPDVTQIAPTLAMRQEAEAVPPLQTVPALPSSQEMLQCIDEIRGYLSKELGYTGPVHVLGIGWGGEQAFTMSMQRTYFTSVIIIGAATPHSPGALARITAPIYGFYGSNDPACTYINDTRRYMWASGKAFNPVIFPGVDAGYLSHSQDSVASQNKKAALGTISGIKAILAGFTAKTDNR